MEAGTLAMLDQRMADIKERISNMLALLKENAGKHGQTQATADLALGLSMLLQPVRDELLLAALHELAFGQEAE